VGRGGDDNIPYQEIKTLAGQIADQIRQRQSSGGTGGGVGGNQ
jgi:hypothetical protein